MRRKHIISFRKAASAPTIQAPAIGAGFITAMTNRGLTKRVGTLVVLFSIVRRVNWTARLYPARVCRIRRCAAVRIVAAIPKPYEHGDDMTRMQAMQAEQTARALRQSEQFEKLLELGDALDRADLECAEEIERLERA